MLLYILEYFYMDFMNLKIDILNAVNALFQNFL